MNKETSDRFDGFARALVGLRRGNLLDRLSGWLTKFNFPESICAAPIVVFCALLGFLGLRKPRKNLPPSLLIKEHFCRKPLWCSAAARLLHNSQFKSKLLFSSARYSLHNFWFLCLFFLPFYCSLFISSQPQIDFCWSGTSKAHNYSNLNFFRARSTIDEWKQKSEASTEFRKGGALSA